MSGWAVEPGEGWGVLHLFFHLRRDLLVDAQSAAKDFCARVGELDGAKDRQVLTFAVLGQKADLGLMVLGPDLVELDRFAGDLAASPLGQALAPAGSYVSLTELSEYTTSAADEGLEPGTPEHEAFEQRMAEYAEHRLHPRLPARKVLSFYPMSKRREAGDNWYTLAFAERKRLMAGHAALGRSYRGRVLQLITGSVGLDDWEWGVTLLADDPAVVKEIVYEMRFDEVSARYGEFGPFVTGLVMPPDALVRHLGLV